MTSIKCHGNNEKGTLEPPIGEPTLPARHVIVEDVDQLTTQSKSDTYININIIFHVCTLNARTLQEEGRVQELELFFEKIKWDVVGLNKIEEFRLKYSERLASPIFKIDSQLTLKLVQDHAPSSISENEHH